MITKDLQKISFIKFFQKKKYKSIVIKSLGFGPFTASYGLIQTYLKFFPIIREIILIICYIIDAFIQVFVKTRLKEIYPIGYFFTIKK